MISESKRQPLDPAVVDRLLDGLSSDDDFRTLFTKDPRAALEKVGYKATGNEQFGCVRTTTLAAKEEIAAARKLLASHLVRNNAAMTVIFSFEAGKIETTLSKA